MRRSWSGSRAAMRTENWGKKLGGGGGGGALEKREVEFIAHCAQFVLCLKDLVQV